MFEIGVLDEFEAAHALSGDFGPATRLHGHTYKVEVRIEASEIDSTGTFFDLGKLRSNVRSVLEKLHYRNLSVLESFAGTNTTSEVVARYIFSQLAPDARAGRAATLKVTVWESSSCFASYRESFEAEAQSDPR